VQLFKYVTADRIDVLKNGLIRFTQATGLNDPWEMKPYLRQLLSDASLDKLAMGRKSGPSNIVQDEQDFKLFWKAQRKKIPNLSKKEARKKFDEYLKKNPHVRGLVEHVAERYARERFRSTHEDEFKQKFFEITRTGFKT
jgi:hypothetical protein